MKIIKEQWVRYGEKDFDESYINWGFHNESEQIKDANSILKLLGSNKQKILDAACGIGRYHKVWSDNGHQITGIDLSETFIQYCKVNNFSIAEYKVCDMANLPYQDEFDFVTWIDPAYVCGKFIRNIFRCLKQKGIMIFDSRNPNYPKYRELRNNKGKNWTYKDGIYKLTRDEYNSVPEFNKQMQLFRRHSEWLTMEG